MLHIKFTVNRYILNTVRSITTTSTSRHQTYTKLATMSSNSSNRWKDSESNYPFHEEIADTIRDHGQAKRVKTKAGEETRTKLPKIEKLVAKVYSGTQKELNHPGMDKNIGREKEPLYRDLNISRKLVEITTVDSYFLWTRPFNYSTLFLTSNTGRVVR
jgi:hypothetical protein